MTLTYYVQSEKSIGKLAAKCRSVGQRRNEGTFIPSRGLYGDQLLVAVTWRSNDLS